MSYGWMGRSPDYKASLMNTLGANHQFYGKLCGQRPGLVSAGTGSRPVLNHAIVNPLVDAPRRRRVGDVFITIRKRPTPASTCRG